MYCWGNNRLGQLGLPGQDNEEIHFTANDCFDGWAGVQKVACGEAHTLFLLQDGNVLSCGQNLRGQLGRKSSGSNLEPIHALEAQTIIDLSCGLNHSVAICSEGNLFTWGNALHGELGSGQLTQQSPIPRRITGLSDIKIIQVACGDYHTIALSEDSSVYTWGKNDAGQLGLGYQTSNHASPQNLKSLRGVPLVQIAAGGSQSFALSMSGMVFGWGKNNVGQLGFKIGPQKAGMFKPYAVSSLRSFNIVYISCGSEHTAVLSKDGTVYTFGDGRHGQLGKNMEGNTAEPQKIEEYEGQVSQIACGSYHTLLYVFTSNCIVSLGRGLQPKPETSTSDQSEPPQQPGELDISGLICPKDFVNIHIKRIFAGNYVSFTTSSLQPQNHKTTTLTDNLQKICRLDKAMVNMWTDANSGRERNQDAKRQINKIFSSSACLSASFLKQASSLDSSSIVDLDVASELFTQLCQCKWIMEILCSILKTDLIPGIECLPPLYEALSIFLLLSKFPIMYDVKICLPLVSPLAHAINNISKNALKMLESMWSSLSENHLRKLIHMFKVSLVVAVLSGQEEPKDLLQVLKKLYKVNLKAKYKVPEIHFCVPEVSEVILIPMDLANWRKWQNQPDSEDSTLPAIYCRFPYILMFPTKINYLHIDAEMKKTAAKVEAQQMLMMNRMHVNSETPRIPILHLKVRRENLLEDTLHKLSIVEDCDLRKQLLVQFLDETSADPRATLIEFFLIMGEKMVHPDYGLFYCPDPMSPVWFPSHAPAQKKKYYYYGIVCGLAIFNQWVMYLPFPLALFKKLLGKKTTLDDLKELQPTLGRSLQIILDAKEDLEALQLNFTITWENRTVELIPNGTAERVTSVNKHDYVNKYVDYIFNTSVAEAFEEFKAGLHKVCDKDILSFFQPDELKDLVAGLAIYDWHMFEQNTQYMARYFRDHPTITMFWKVFHELTLPQKKGFLYFLTGNDKIPVFGLENTCMKISSFGAPKTSHLPEAQTCSQLLLLPDYSKESVLRKKLLLAIENNKGLDRI